MSEEKQNLQWSGCSHYWTSNEGQCLLCDRQKTA